MVKKPLRARWPLDKVRFLHNQFDGRYPRASCSDQDIFSCSGTYRHDLIPVVGWSYESMIMLAFFLVFESTNTGGFRRDIVL